MRKRGLALLLCLTMMSAVLPTAALAADERAIQLGSGGIGSGDRVYMGRYGSYDVPWIVVSGGTFGQTGVSGKTVKSLLSEYVLGTSKFHSSSSIYNGSTLQAAMNSIYSGFSAVEQGAVADTTLKSASLDAVTSGDLTGQKLFPLSSSEAAWIPAAYKQALEISYPLSYLSWWTRTAYSDEKAYYMTGRDAYVSSGSVSGTEYVRPAFHLDMSGILFTSAASGGKSAAGAEGGLAAVPASSPSAWKLTLLDAARSFSVSTAGVSATTAGGTVSIDYSGAKTGDREYLSAMITDSSNKALYYGRLDQLTAGEDSGTLSIDVPAGLEDGSYTLRLFNEQYNGNNGTDYSSAFADLPMTVTIYYETNGLFAGRFNAETQLFDAEYSYNDTEAGVGELSYPLSDGGVGFTSAELAGKYIRFRDLHATVDGLPKVAMHLYNGDGTPAEISGKAGADGLVAQGKVVFIADEGILFVSGTQEYFIPNSAGFAHGALSGSELYLRRNPIKGPTLAQLAVYNASDTPMNAGEVLLRFYANGENVTGMPAPDSIPIAADTGYTLDGSMNPSRTDHIFVDWNTNPDGSGITYAPGAVYNAGAGADLYAQWRDASVTEQPQAAPAGVRAADAVSFGGWGSLTGTTAAMQYRTAADENTWYRCADGSTSVPTGEYWVRLAPKAGYSASPGVGAGRVIAPSATPAQSDFTAANVTANGGNDGRITKNAADPAVFEYSTDGGVTYRVFAGTELDGLPACVVLIRKQAVGDVSLASDTVTLYVKQPAAAAPNTADFVISHVTACGGSDGAVSGVNSTMEYRLSGAGAWSEISGASLAGLTTGEYEIRYRETSTVLPSDDVSVFVKQPFENPPAVGATSAAAVGEAGAITGTTAAMEYRNGDAAWKDCSAGSTAVLPGLYSVRYKETAENTPLPAAVIAVNPVLPVAVGTDIFANGAALVITGADEEHSTIYIDANRNGLADAGEQSLQAAGVTDAPADGTALSGYCVYGAGPVEGSYDTQITVLSGAVGGIFGGGCKCDVTGDTGITVKGGHVRFIFGGGHSGVVTGDTHVTVSGGTVQDSIYGGGRLADDSTVDAVVSGSTSVIISGGSAGSVCGGGLMSSVTGNATLTVSGGTVTGDVYGGNAAGAATVSVSGNPKISSVALSTLTGNRLIISGALTGAAGDIGLSTDGITVHDGVVLCNAATPAHADTAVLAFAAETAGFHLAHNTSAGTVYIAINTGTLTVEPNGGTWKSSDETQSFTEAYSSMIGIPVPARTGYTFTGWTRTNSYGLITSLTVNATYTFGATDGVTDTLTAEWEANSYTVSYSADKPAGATGAVTGVPADESCTYDVDFVLGAAPALVGYTFGGWYTDAGCTAAGLAGDAGDSVSNLSAVNNATVILYAKWTANTDTAYKVEHYVMDTEGNWSSTATRTTNSTGTSDAVITVSALKDATLEVTNGIVYYNGMVGGMTVSETTVLPDGSRVIKLYYSRERHQLTLTKGTGIDTVSASCLHYYDESIFINAVISVGYTWDKWTSGNTHLLAGSTAKDYAFNMPAGDVTLTAGAAPKEYGVSYDSSRHGSLTGATAYYTSAYTATLVPDAGYAPPQSITVTMGGAAFTDFAYDGTTGVITVAAGKVSGNIVITGSCTLRDYTVTCDTGGGSAIAAGSYDITDTDFTLPTAPARTGYAFTGWRVTEGAAGGAGFAPDTLFGAADSSVTLSGSYGSVTLTAQWTAHTYTVTYDANGGSGRMTDGTATHDTAFTLPDCGFSAPAGKQFSEWAIGSATGAGVAAGGTYGFTADAAVYAVWEDADPVEHEVIRGQDGAWAKGSSNGLAFTADVDYAKFTGVSMDGRAVSDDDYDSRSGSTIVTLKAAYLEALSAGRHTLRISFTDGYAEAHFTVKAAASPGNPATGDDLRPRLWLGNALLAGAALAACRIPAQRKRRHG